MTEKTLSGRLSAYDAGLALLLLFTLAAIGYFVFGSNPESHRRYTAALLEFSLADGLLMEDLYRLETGGLSHYDTLVANERILRSAEHRLSHLPPHLEGSAELGRLVTELATLLNQKLAHMEDYKTTRAALRAGMDSLGALADEVRRSPGGAQIPRELLADTANRMLVFVNDPAARHREAVEALLDQIEGQAAGLPLSEPPPALGNFAGRAAAIVSNTVASQEQRRAITAIPLSTAGAQLSYAYHRAHQHSRQNAVAFMSAVLATLIAVMIVLTYINRWRTFQAEADIEARQQSLAAALKEARAQTATLSKGEAAAAATLAEERLAALLRHTFETIAIISREENFIFLSPAVTAMLGLSEKELIGKSVYEGIHADDLIRVKDYLTRAQKELQTDQTISYRLMDARGKWHLVESFASNQYSNPAIRGMVLNTRRLDATPDAAPQ